MNKTRRKSLQNIIDQLVELKANLEDFQVEEEEYRDNMPKNLQASKKYEKAEDAISYLEDAASNLEEVISSIIAAME